jgi:hypothetical protein
MENILLAAKNNLTEIYLKFYSYLQRVINGIPDNNLSFKNFNNKETNYGNTNKYKNIKWS